MPPWRPPCPGTTHRSPQGHAGPNQGSKILIAQYRVPLLEDRYGLKNDNGEVIPYGIGPTRFDSASYRNRCRCRLLRTLGHHYCSSFHCRLRRAVATSLAANVCGGWAHGVAPAYTVLQCSSLLLVAPHSIQRQSLACRATHIAYQQAIWLGIMQERDDDILRFGLIGCLYFRQNKKLTVLYRFWGHLPSNNRILILANWAFTALAPGSTRCLAQNPYRTIDFLMYRALVITKADATRRRRVSTRPQAGAWVPRLSKKEEDDRP